MQEHAQRVQDLLEELFPPKRYTVSPVDEQGIITVHDRLLESWCGIGLPDPVIVVEAHREELYKLVQETLYSHRKLLELGEHPH